MAIRDAIRAEVGDAAIINFSTGTVGVPVAKRIAYLEAGRPEVAALNMGSMNYAKYSRSRKDFVFKFVFANPFDEIIELLEAMRRLEIKPEHECFDLGHVGSLAPLVDMGLLEAPLHADFVMGVVGGVPASARNLAAMADNLPRRARHHWGVIGIGRDQWMLVAAALTLGGSVRVGLEDNFYLPNGEMARSNGDLIAKARQLTEDAGRRPATVAEARALLGIKARALRRRLAFMNLPLDGLKVLDLTRLLPGGFCSLLLADFGADVIKVEDTGAGRLRPLGAPVLRGRRARARGARCSWRSTAASARSAIDLKTPQARRCCCGWSRDADVLLESFRPGVLDRLGVGYERLREENPGLVYCAITGYGQDGPNRDRSGHDTQLPRPQRAPRADRRGRWSARVRRPAQIADLGGGALMAAVGILIALRERERSGEGQLVDCSMFDGSLSFLAMLAGRDRSPTGQRPRRGELRLAGGDSSATGRTGAPTATSRSGRSSPSSGQTFCEGVGREDLLEHAFDPPGSDSASTPSARCSPTRTREQWRAFAVRARLLPRAGPRASTRRSTPSSSRPREMVVELDQPGAERPVRLLGAPVKLSRTPADPGRAPGPGARRAHRRGAGAGRLQRRGDRGAARVRRRGGRGQTRSAGRSWAWSSGGRTGKLKMSELAERSGVSAGTIKHYLREGLLGLDGRRGAHEPQHGLLPRASSCERIQLIKRLQEERFMPLRVIRELIGRRPRAGGAG